MFRQVLNGFCHKTRQVLLVGLEREEGMNALECRVVRSDFRVEMQPRDSATVVYAFLYNGDRGIIARGLYGKRHQATPRAAAAGGQTSPL